LCRFVYNTREILTKSQNWFETPPHHCRRRQKSYPNLAWPGPYSTYFIRIFDLGSGLKIDFFIRIRAGIEAILGIIYPNPKFSWTGLLGDCRGSYCDPLKPWTDWIMYFRYADPQVQTGGCSRNFTKSVAREQRTARNSKHSPRSASYP
jgi:hypothetical protein